MAEETAIAAVETIAEARAGQVAEQVETGGGQPQDAETAVLEPLDPSYVSRASAFNLNEEDLRTVPRDVVERMIAGADRMTINAARREDQYQPPYVPSNGRDNAQTNVAVQPAEFAFDPFELKFDPEAEIGEPIVKNMTAQQKWAADQLTKLHKHYAGQFEAVRQFAEGVQRQQDYGILDRFVEGQGAEWAGVFGKGSTLEMNPQSQEFLNREEVRTAAIAMMQRSAANGRKMSAAEALPRARNAMFMEKAFAIERAKANGKRTQLEAGAADRPRTPGGVPVPLTIKDKAKLLREAAARA